MTTAISFLDGRITINPDICNGRPTIRGQRIAVQTILEFLGAGDGEADILEQYPSLEPEDIRACLRFALVPKLRLGTRCGKLQLPESRHGKPGRVRIAHH